MSGQKEMLVKLAEDALEHAKPHPNRRNWLKTDDAIRMACRSDQRTSGNWGYWIRSLRAPVEKLIEAERNRRQLESVRRRAQHRVAA